MLLSLLLSLSISSAAAQAPVFCPTRPPGDNTNACASTAFVQGAIGGLVVGTSTITNGTSGSYLYDNAGILGEIPGGGVPTNVLNTQTTNYTLATTDCGKRVQLGTGSTGFLTLSVPAVSGFSSTCRVEVINGDTTRGKSFTGAGLPTNTPLLLLQQQAIEFSIINGVWTVTSFPGRLKLTPNATITLNTDFAAGNDANDGLGLGAGNALKTVEGCLSLIANYFDFNSTASPSKAICLMAAGSTDTNGIHQAFHAFVGCNGGACVVIDGNTTGTISSAVQFYFGSVIQLRRITLTSAGNCLEVHWTAKVYILDLVTFGACVGTQILIGDGAGHVELSNSYTVSGSTAFPIQVSDGGSLKAVPGITITISNSITITDWVLVASPAYVNLQGATFNLGGNVVTGAKTNVLLNGVVLQSTSTLAVTGAVSGTGAVCRLTMASTASLAEGQKIIVAGIAGATGCNTASPPVGSTTHIVDGTHIELTGTTFGGAYTSGGTVQIGLPGTADPSVSLGGQFL